MSLSAGRIDPFSIDGSSWYVDSRRVDIVFTNVRGVQLAEGRLLEDAGFDESRIGRPVDGLEFLNWLRDRWLGGVCPDPGFHLVEDSAWRCAGALQHHAIGVDGAYAEVLASGYYWIERMWTGGRFEQARERPAVHVSRYFGGTEHG